MPGRALAKRCVKPVECGPRWERPRTKLNFVSAVLGLEPKETKKSEEERADAVPDMGGSAFACDDDDTLPRPLTRHDAPLGHTYRHLNANAYNPGQTPLMEVKSKRAGERTRGGRNQAAPAAARGGRDPAQARACLGYARSKPERDSWEPSSRRQKLRRWAESDLREYMADSGRDDIDDGWCRSANKFGRVRERDGDGELAEALRLSAESYAAEKAEDGWMPATAAAAELLAREASFDVIDELERLRVTLGYDSIGSMERRLPGVGGAGDATLALLRRMPGLLDLSDEEEEGWEMVEGEDERWALVGAQSAEADDGFVDVESDVLMAV